MLTYTGVTNFEKKQSVLVHPVVKCLKNWGEPPYF